MEVDVLQWLDELDIAKPATKVTSTPAQTLTASVSTGTTFEIDRDVLLHLLEKAVIVVPTRDMVPVLNNFQFVVKAGSLKIIASSLEMSIAVSTTQVDTKVEGIEVFPARTLLNIVKESASGNTIFFEVTGNSAVIVSGGFSIEIALPNGSDFPRLDFIDDVEFHEVERRSFVEAISAVKYALPNKDFGGQSTLKMISIKGGKFTVCDGSRFHQVRIDGFKLNMQLPSWSITTLLKVLTGTDQEFISVGEVDKKLVFKLDTCVFYMNKLTDPYPNVEQLWLRPALSNDQALYVDKAELLTAIKQVKIAADTDSNAIALIINETEIEVRAKEMNKAAKVIVPCKWQGKSKSVVVNYLHLAELLKAYNPAECKFMLGDDTTQRKAPIMLKDDDTMAIGTISQMLAYRAGLV